MEGSLGILLELAEISMWLASEVIGDYFIEAYLMQCHHHLGSGKVLQENVIFLGCQMLGLPTQHAC